jgi:NAD(P)-dependent dehydrogenase (short-subunit alcohol dehydrogenase family)
MPVAVVTGGAGDIGRAICLRLGRDGYEIAVADIRADACEPAIAELEGQGIVAFAAAVDITDPASVAAMQERVAQRGEVAVVVNNAGKASAPDFEAAGDDDWFEALSINLNGAYNVTRAFLPGLKTRGAGVVVNISSGNGLVYAGNPAYSVAKAGLIHYTRMLAVEYGVFGIRAVCVVPGSVRTRAWDERIAFNPDVFEQLKQLIPLRRITEPMDVANAVAFAVSDDARAITGSTLTVDGGALAGNRAKSDLITAGDRRQ